MNKNYQLRMFKSITPLFIAVGICFAPLVAHADIYRWTDENGKVHFSDKPLGDKAKKLDIKEQPSAPEPTQTRDQRKKKVDQYLRARKEERMELDKQEKEKKRLKKEQVKKCKAAKREYKKVTESTAVYYKNKDGTRDYLEEGQRDKEEARLKNEVTKWCK